MAKGYVWAEGTFYFSSLAVLQQKTNWFPWVTGLCHLLPLLTPVLQKKKKKQGWEQKRVIASFMTDPHPLLRDGQDGGYLYGEDCTSQRPNHPPQPASAGLPLRSLRLRSPGLLSCWLLSLLIPLHCQPKNVLPNCILFLVQTMFTSTDMTWCWEMSSHS